MGTKETLTLVVLAGVAVFALWQMLKRRAVTPPMAPVVPAVPDSAKLPELGDFLGLYFDTDCLQEGGITRIQLTDRKLGCGDAASHRGYQKKHPGEGLVEFCVIVTHLESGKKMPVYIDASDLRCDERWTSEGLMYFYPLAERPGTGKPTNCNPAIQKILDAQYAAFEAAQAALDATMENKVAAKSCGKQPCVALPGTSPATEQPGVETIGWDIWVRFKDAPEVRKHWKQTSPVVRSVCAKKSSKK